MTNPADLSIPEAARALRDGQLSARNLAEASLARIAALNPALHAFTYVSDDAIEAAELADARIAAGDANLLCGIPIAVKDLIDIKGQPSTSGSRVFAGRVAPSDGASVARLRAAGAVLIGKVATYEFAMVGPDRSLPDPPARNPWDTSRITGGSSSGSAAAVAASMVRAAVGTDTGGSIRSPAAYCGCVGLKPSYGRTSRDGAFPLSPSLDHVGPIAASVEEAAIVLDAMTEGEWPSAMARIGVPLTDLTIGFARSWHQDDDQTSPAVIGAMDDAAALFSQLGARIRLVDLPSYAAFEATGSIILHAEALEEHRELLAEKAALYGKATLQCLAFGAAIDPDDLAIARTAQAALSQDMDRAMEGCDLLLTATTLSPALPFTAFDEETAVWTPMRTIPFNVTGQPAMSIPCGFDAGLPLGLQLIARRGNEDVLVQAGHAFERASDISVQRPLF